MRKVQIQRFGDEDVLEIVECARPSPAKGECLVRVLVSALSGADINMRRGAYPMQPPAPLTPGYSIVGVIERNGEGAGRFAIGTTVCALTVYGGQSEYICLPEKLLHAVPAGADPAAAVTLVLDGMTAFQMITRKTKLQSGQCVFVHGVSGAVGLYLAEFAREQNLQVFGTASAAKHEALRPFDVKCFDYRNPESFVSAVQAMGGVDAVFDPLGFESFRRSYAMLRRGGTLVGYGFNSAVFQNRKRSFYPSFVGLFLRNLIPDGRRSTFYSINRESPDFAIDLATLLARCASGRLKPVIKRSFPMAEIQAAHRFWQSGDGLGTIVIRIADS